MPKNLSLSLCHVGMMIADCASIAKATATTDQKACGKACTIVASLIVNAQPWGGAQQKAIMDMASKEGFTPMYWNDSVRVNFTPEGHFVAATMPDGSPIFAKGT